MPRNIEIEIRPWGTFLISLNIQNYKEYSRIFNQLLILTCQSTINIKQVLEKFIFNIIISLAEKMYTIFR